MKIDLDQCLSTMAQPRHYSREQWFALIFSILCLGVDAWAALRTFQASQARSGSFAGGNPTLGFELWAVEALLGVAALTLLVFAFSAPPEA